QTSTAVISSLDLYPTILDMISGSIFDDVTYDGQSVKDAILENTDTGTRVLFYYCSDRLNAVRYGPYKFHFFTCEEYNSAIHKVCKHGVPQENFYQCLPCDGKSINVHDPPIMFNIELDPSELYPLDINRHSDILEKVVEALLSHKETLTVRPSLLVTSVPSLHPCCNPPYCMCDKTKLSWQTCDAKQ
ncbi:arylsulfatase-like, partial [Anneissia japonica]|uniref:arylsulfatase-like n=1 Tax=Anneissia japonica TaxID=1529436 RepID=UPI001425AF4B